MAVILLVEAIGLGTFSLPSAFAILGVVAGVICCVALGFVVIYTWYLVGMVKVRYPQNRGSWRYWRPRPGSTGKRGGGQLVCASVDSMTASFCLTGTIAFNTLSDEGACGLVFGVVSAILLFLFAIAPSFTEATILGYIDLVSVTITLGITIIGSGIEASNAPAGIAGRNWSAWPAPGATFKDGMVAVCNIMFAYSFCMFITPFMAEMHTPQDFIKSVWTLGIIEMVIYTLIGSLIFVFVGADVQSPSLLSLQSVLPKVTFGIALPLIFISGAIGNTVTARYVHLRMYRSSIVRFINTPKGWITWFATLATITVIAWVLAEAIPFFEDLLALSSALLISGFVLYFPPVMWFTLLRDGAWYARENLLLAFFSGAIFLLGLLILAGGTYASIVDILHHYNTGAVRSPFAC